MQPRLQSDFDKKIQQARQAGFSDTQISQYLTQRGLAPQAQAPQQQAPRPTGGRGGTATSLISEGSGLAGALAGGAAGASIGSIVPGIGTAIGGVIGAGIGGFLGGSGGSAAEQQIRDGKVDTRKALTEGAIEGLFSAGPLRLIRGGKALAKGAKATRGLSVADDLSQALVGTTTKAGRATTGAARGIRTGAKAGGDRLRPQQAQEINEFLTKTVKTRAAAPATQLEDLAKYQQGVISKLDNTIEKFNKTLDPKDKISIVNKLGKSFNDNLAGATKSQRELATQLAKEASQKGSLKDLNDYVKLLDNQINFNRPQDAVSAQREQVFRLFRKELRDSIADDNVIPGLKGLKTNLSKAYQAEELLLESAGRMGSAFNPLGARVPNRLIQGAQARVGRGLERAGGALDSTNPLSTALRVGAGSQVASGLNTGMGAGQLEQTDPTFAGDLTQQDTFSQLSGALGGGMGDMGGQMQQQQPQQTSGLTQEQINQAILMDLQETGGENVKQIQLIAEMYGPQEVDKATQEGTAKMQTAQTIVDNLMQVYQSVGGPKGVYGGTAADIAGRLNVGQSNERARAYQQNRMSYLTPIIKAFGEVGVLTDKDREVVANAIPSITDTPAQAEQKINLLYQMLQSLGSSGSVPTEEANMAIQQIEAGR